MNLTTLILLSLSMSADAFAVSVAKGASDKHMRWLKMIKTAAIFGIVESITPLIGWLVGTVAAPYIEALDHWISFILLVGLGIKMIYEAINDNDEEENANAKSGSLSLLILTAIATSIDSMIVGVSLAFLNVNIILTALCIGFSTMIMSAIGLKIGGVLGTRIGKRAEISGGLVLMGIGIFILCEHLGFLS